MNYGRSEQVKSLLATIKKDGLGRLRERQRAVEGREHDELADLLVPPGTMAGAEVGLVEASTSPAEEESVPPLTGTRPPRPRRQSSPPGVPPSP